MIIDCNFHANDQVKSTIAHQADPPYLFTYVTKHITQQIV